MTALSITATAIIPGSDASVATGTAGESITAGMPVFMDASNANKLYKADANLSSAAAVAVGISLHAATAGQPLSYIRSGSLGMGTILTRGLVYVVGAGTAGDINPAADLAQGWYTTVLGYASSTSNLVVGIVSTGVALA